MAILPSKLPEGFLTEPSSKITRTRIDFASTELPEYRDLYAVVLDNVLTTDECSIFLQAAETTASEKGWELAMVNVGGGRQRLMTDVRNCGRIIWDCQEIVDRVWRRIKGVPEVQEIIRLENAATVFGNGPAKRDEVWEFSRLNERMRFLKYVGGEYFNAHCDGVYETPDGKERSYYILHLYLNNADVVNAEEMSDLKSEEKQEHADDVLIGGATSFHSINMKRKLDVAPVAGRVLLFQHRGLLHSGADVVSGVKYTMRTDLPSTLAGK